MQKGLESYGSSGKMASDDSAHTHTRHSITLSLDEAADLSKFEHKSKDVRPGSILLDQVFIHVVYVVLMLTRCRVHTHLPIRRSCMIF